MKQGCGRLGVRLETGKQLREGFGGKLIIKESQGQRKGTVFDNTSTSEDEGLTSDFRQLRGECLKPKVQMEGRGSLGNGSVPRDLSQGIQDISLDKSRNIDSIRGELIRKGDRDEDDEVSKIMAIGVQMGINFNEKEREMANFIRRREKENANRCGQNGRQ
ncbi:hypothetical protein QYF36_010307 [Acer negundo]|nr:hypothetical protein QYF36_010307 [Acer negundo]